MPYLIRLAPPSWQTLDRRNGSQGRYFEVKLVEAVNSNPPRPARLEYFGPFTTLDEAGQFIEWHKAGDYDWHPP